MSLWNICELKYKSFFEDSMWKSCLQNLSNPFIYYGVHWRYLPVHSVYRLCPRAIHEWGILARSIFPQLTPFLKLSKARAFWSIRPTEGGDLSHRLAARRKSYSRTTCYARHIRCKSTFPKARLLGVEVPNELPLKSNSSFAR